MYSKIMKESIYSVDGLKDFTSKVLLVPQMLEVSSLTLIKLFQLTKHSLPIHTLMIKIMFLVPLKRKLLLLANILRALILMKQTNMKKKLFLLKKVK